MTRSERDKLTTSLSRLLPDEPEVRVTGVASLGAQRQTLFLELSPRNRKTSPQRAVAQIASEIVPAGSIEIEGAILQAATIAGVPVPKVLAVDPDLRAIVSQHVDGETIPRKILRLVEANPELGSRLASDVGQAFASIHGMATGTLGRLEDYGDPQRYIAELEALTDDLSTPHPIFRLGLSWLKRHLPAPRPRDASGSCLVHGDLRIGNFIASVNGLTAVLDWELAHLGDPMEDLAWICLRTWRFGHDEHEVGGFGNRRELRAAYEKAGGLWRQDAFDWWTVARTLWWGNGLARQVQVFLTGGSDSIVLAASGRRVAELEYDLLTLIDEKGD